MSDTLAQTLETQPSATRAGHGLKDLLVFQEDTPAATNAFAYAEKLAETTGAHLAGLMFGLVPMYPMTVYMEATPDIWLQAQRRADEEAAAMEARLRARFLASSIRAEFRRVDAMEAEAGRILALHGRYADGVIVGWSGDGGSDFERNLFEAALFNSGRPVVLVPKTFQGRGLPSRILIAWNAQREAARAVHDALPLLKSASSVRVVVVDNHIGSPHGDDPGVDITRHLARHNVQIETKHVPSAGRTIASVLQDEARYFGADLLVLGGYGHSRMAEWIMGGVTRDLLNAPEQPLLFSH
jgi:nucleotide-binding universal stress UspA family protein